MDARRGGDPGAGRVVPAAERRAALAAVMGWIRCPVCAGPVRLEGGQLACERGHRFDIARQGYVNLVAGRPGPGTGDTAEMVAAREDFLARGHYRPLADAIASLAARYDAARPGPASPGTARDHGGAGMVADLAGGTGYYLASVLDALPGRPGVCLDLSVPALRRAARAHPRAAAIGADAWRPLPLAEGSAALVLSVFGPRNAPEITRVLAPGGTLIIASPGPGHLGELRGPLAMIGVDEDKDRRLADAFGGYERAGSTVVNHRVTLGHDDIAVLVGMGPSARHIAPETLTSRIRDLPATVTVTVDVRVRVLQRPALPEGGPDRDRALRDQLDHRAEVRPPVGRPGIAAPPRAAVTARLVQCAGQRANRAEQLRAGGVIQPGQHRVDLREQAGNHPETARELGSGLRAADLAHPPHRQVGGVGEVHRDADQGVIRVLAAGAEVQGRAHVAAVGTHPLRPRRPVVFFLVVTLIPLCPVGIRLAAHEVPEFAGVQAEHPLQPGDIAPAQQIEQRLLVPYGPPFVHDAPPYRMVELTFQPYDGGMTKPGGRPGPGGPAR